MARLGTGITLLIGAAAGAAAQYFLDNQSGRRRRSMARDQGLSTVRQQATETARKAQSVAGQAKGAVASVVPHGSDSHQHEQLGDAGLARKVETEIFRAADAPKGKVVVNAENGVVFLRGEVDREWIDRLGRDAENVGGVVAVRNLLHAPGTPAPTAPGQGWSAPTAGIS
jgi:osmotically-inducible protein OsmY